MSAQTLQARGLRFAVHRWGEDGAPALVLLHGWGDSGASFAPLAERWARHAPVAAPDMRGFGGSDHLASGDYYFSDYIPDLDALLAQLSPQAPVALVGHSMGAQIASLYAGIRPERVAQLVILDGLHLPDSDPADAPKRYRRWLAQLAAPTEARAYESFDALAERVRHQHPALSEADALRIAHAWGHAEGEGVVLRMDPRHRIRGPLLYRAAESKAIWREITAPTLFVDGARSPFPEAVDAEERAARRACFARHEVVTLPEAGHMLHFDAPEATAETVESWLRTQGWPAPEAAAAIG
ncbi:alpha/beta fold hydrolase [Algiphilus aromaticivorans]|uniref:alpha/beta fold hydrolase n=1 Tax=Algiphilus aromaticivorans TaxID=382454 RepID=UPI000694B8DF|nr:alpha/beta hydrolase [Algiphilus aromaticivorans]